MHEQKGWIYDVLTCYMKFLKYDSSKHQIEGIHHVQLKKNLVKVKVQDAPDAIDYNFTSTFGCNFEIVWRKMCCKGITKLKP